MSQVKTVIDSLKENNLEVLIDEPMKNHTTFKIGGNIDTLVIPKNVEEIQCIVRICKKNNIIPFIFGNGSNLLVSDKGIRGVGIKLYNNFSNIKVIDNILIVESGILMGKAANIAVDNSLEGFEFASGIPGTIGGAVTMNAGAYGGEMKDIVKSVKCMDLNGDIFTLSNSEMEFEYRNSLVSKKSLIILEVEIQLKKGNLSEIKEKLRELTEKRTSKQPLNFPSCGSTFKRPEGHYAAKLIEDAGLKGYRYKNVQVSEKHSGFVISTGESKAEDVIHLIEYIQKVVMNKFGIKLETEVKILGE